MNNWLARQNPWSLMPPPDWWLRRLFQRDPALRVLPGITEPCYRIARVSSAMRKVKPLLGNEGETGRMCREGLVPVVSLRPGVTWNDDFFRWLDAHDTWRVGGAEKFVDALDLQEREQLAALDRATDDEADARASSAYFGKLVRDGAVAFLTNADSAG